MAKYPSISKGLGKLTPALWTRLMAMLEWFEVNKTTVERSNQPGHTKKHFLAKITANSLIDGELNRYEYEWAEVVLDAASGFELREDGLSGTTALNLCEMSNVENNVSPGVDLLGAAYPAGFTMRAIGDCIDDTYIEPVVVMFLVRDVDSVLRYVFSLANVHDGTCTV